MRCTSYQGTTTWCLVSADHHGETKDSLSTLCLQLHSIMIDQYSKMIEMSVSAAWVLRVVGANKPSISNAATVDEHLQKVGADAFRKFEK